MRPQRNAAENHGYSADAAELTAASMRPQRNAAENDEIEPLLPADFAASMRPQRNAAENPRAGHTPGRATGRFNEAAA